MIQVISVTNHLEATMPLVKSLLKHNWRHSIIETEWRGFGTKLIKTYEYLKQNPEITEFIFCDSFDVLAFGTPEELKWELENHFQMPKTGGILISGERGLWPPDMEVNRDSYIRTDGGFDFPNSGLYYATSDAFIKCVDTFPVNYADDDQRWFHNVFLSGIVDMWIDSDCKIFQSCSFIQEGEYDLDCASRPYNTIVKNMATFYHGNGGGLPQEIYKLAGI